MLNVRWADGGVDTYLATTTTTAGKAGARCQPAENKASKNSGRGLELNERCQRREAGDGLWLSCGGQKGEKKSLIWLRSTSKAKIR